MSASDILLEARDLSVFFGSLQAVRGVSLRVPRGTIVALLGANGAGKSSVLRALCGLIPARGMILLDGLPIGALRPGRRVERGMAAVQEGRDIFPSLSVEENLLVGAYLRRDRTAVRRDLMEMYDLFPLLAPRRKELAGALSGGGARMLAIARALMTSPRLLLLDEPSHGLAPAAVDTLFALIPRLHASRDLTVLLVEQNANRALQVASHGYVLQNGCVELEGPTDRLSVDPQVQALYLGG